MTDAILGCIYTPQDDECGSTITETKNATSGEHTDSDGEAAMIQTPQTVKPKLIAERDDLLGKLKRLGAFQKTDDHDRLTERHQTFLSRQKMIIALYINVLNDRIEDLSDSCDQCGGPC